jgi:phenylacetate-CoA ligase
MVWNRDYECMPVEEIQKFQLEKLKETVNWVSEKVPFYQNKLKEMGISADDLKSIEDSAKLPVTVKNDLRDNYPFDLCAVPMKDIVRVHASSGTTGKPITGPYTQGDMEQWIECMCRSIYSAGVRQEDIVQNAYGYGLFTGGLGFHQAATQMGCAVVPTSSGLTERQITLMQDFGATVLFATPSYALTIAERAEEMKVEAFSAPSHGPPACVRKLKNAWGSRPWKLMA